MKEAYSISAGTPVGAIPAGDWSTLFRVWAPNARTLSVEIGDSDQNRTIPLEASPFGYFEGIVPSAGDGDLYRYIADENPPLPDPASRYQPRGVHGPSAIVDHQTFPWHDAEWQGIPLNQYIIYELHVGTFSPGGTFEAIAGNLDYLSQVKKHTRTSHRRLSIIDYLSRLVNTNFI